MVRGFCAVVALVLTAAAGPWAAEAHRGVGAQLVRRVSCRPAGRARMEEGEKKLGFFEKIVQGFDDLVDDALDRKLGNGASFYGKRKSNFYGATDTMKKADPRVKNAEEDYRGNAGGSYFVWDKETGLPLTKKQARLKKAGKLVLPKADEDE